MGNAGFRTIVLNMSEHSRNPEYVFEIGIVVVVMVW